MSLIDEAQDAQNVHSKLQILASRDEGGSAVSHFSHFSRISSIAREYTTPGY